VKTKINYIVRLTRVKSLKVPTQQYHSSWRDCW